jgi:hypothetical protein
MTHAYWFKPKRFGYGATPSTWEGWAVTGAYCLVVWACVVAIVTHRASSPVLAASLSVIAVATVALIAIGVKKTDGRWGWNAGRKHISGKTE